VVSRYVRGVDEQDVQMSVRSEANIEMLEMNINLPEER
jgi:cell division topological specificity factor